METPLDVLSRAASMVETSQSKGDSAYSSGLMSLDAYDLGSKELPSRALKQDRLKERQDLAHALHIDKEHAAAINARKTASTQTQFSSFNGDAPPYPGPPPPAYFAPRGEPHHGDAYSSVHHPYGPPPPLTPATPHSAAHSSPASLSPPVSGHLVDLSHARVGHTDIQNAPLNLSLSTSSPKAASSASSLVTSRRLPQPTVITCTSSSSSSPVSSGGSSPHGPNGLGQHSPSAASSPPAVSLSDPAIEEHFRRSLGKSYGDSLPKTTASTTSSVQGNISITESVDDHFAKALGDSTWKAIKSQNDPSLDVFTGSVDDHFAKALGATTWRRIKAETEISENSNASSSSNNTNGSTTTSATPHSSSSLSAPVAT